MDTKHRNKLIWMNILLAVLLASIGMVWFFSNQVGPESHVGSRMIARSLQDFTSDYFTINPTDTFWRINLEAIVRKFAHIFEYALVGLVMCCFLNVLTRRVWLAGLISIIIVPILGYIDEFNQQFTFDRTPSWFDVHVDITGAIIGILLATLFFYIFNYVRKLKRRIKELEEANRQ